MKAVQKNKLKKLATKLKLPREKVPSDEDDLIQFIGKHIDKLKKLDSDKTKAVASQNKRINQILGVLMAYSNLDFSKTAVISRNHDFIDGLAAGINMMGEELKSSTVSLKEKTTLLKEIHHRVKNNLQLVQSLLNIQSSFITDEYSYGKFKDSIERVRSMALIHEKLYLSTDLSKIDFNEYLHSLVSHLFVSYNIDPARISVKISIDAPHRDMDLNMAVPCGLMVNEMLTNSFKYAFPGERKGKISLYYERKRIAGNRSKNVISVQDNGIGFPKNFKIADTTSLGMQLITTLVEQIEGKIEVLKIHGAGLTVSFVTDDE